MADAGSDTNRDSGRGRLVRFVDHVGGAIVQPRQIMTELLQGGRGGLTDLLLLLGLQIVAVHLERLISAGWFMVSVNYAAGLSSLLNIVAQSVLYPVVAVFAATVVASFATRRRVGRQRNTDLAALCAIPALSLDLLLTLVSALSGWRPSPLATAVALGLGLAWFLALLLVAVRLVRAQPLEGAGS